ncbi:MAG: hypothetical protein Q4F88_00380 [Eubacteriales bacterium]|nr:hypothetical protein [Eubacteriales bacterium]
MIKVFSIKKIFAIMLIFMALFYINSYARGWIQVDGYWFYQDNDDNFVTETIMTSGEEKFYLNEVGAMVTDTLIEDYLGSTYYFGSNGAMVKNAWVSVDPILLRDPGQNPPGYFYFYFGPNGKAYRANNGIVKKTIDGQRYLFDEQGRRLYGYVDSSGNILNEEENPFVDALYYCGNEDDGIIRTGWYQVDTGTFLEEYLDLSYIWLYFNENTGEKTKNTSQQDYTTKKISNNTYAFDSNGVMLSGWQDLVQSVQGSKNAEGKYYAKEEDGNLQKKTWVYAVPSTMLNNNDYLSDTERWFYLDSQGSITTSQIKKIDSKYYAFDINGIMQTGLVVFGPRTGDNVYSYLYTIDIERNESSKYIIYRNGKSTTNDKYIYDTNGELQKVRQGLDSIFYFYTEDFVNEKQGSLADKIEVKLSFTDGEFSYTGDKQGSYEGYKSKTKKQYDGGILLKASQDDKFGIACDGQASPSNVAYKINDNNFRQIEYSDSFAGNIPRLFVVNTSGQRLTSANTIKKDNNGYYWVIDEHSQFRKIFTVPIRYKKSVNKESNWQFKSDFTVVTDPNRSTSMYKSFWSITTDINGNEVPTNNKDIYGLYCSTDRNNGNYEYIPQGTEYALNFYWSSTTSEDP